MSPIPSKTATRIATGLKKFQPILVSARSRDVNESDTVVIVTDLLQEVFGYDKFNDVTSEYMIRGTYIDLAIKLEGELKLLIEVKAIGLELKDSFVKQAVDYAANQGVEWVVLTNGVIWRIYKVIFAKPIDFEVVVEYNLCELNPKNSDHLGLAWLLAKESWPKARLDEYRSQKQALSRFTIAAILLSEPITKAIQRETKRISPGIKIEIEAIKQVLRNEVLKREVIEGEKAESAKKVVARSLRASKPCAPSDEMKASSILPATIEKVSDKTET